MLRVTLDVNGKTIGEMHIVRDLTSFGRFRSYAVSLRGEYQPRSRIESFDSEKGAWNLVSEAIKTIRWDGNERIENEAGLLAVKEEGGLCSVCEKPQYETPSGATCENGHGGAPTL